MAISKEYSDNLDNIKKNISSAWSYFHDNYRRYHDFKRYVFKESVNVQQRAVMQGLNRPVLEFNILEAYLSRLLGEFSMHEPSIEVGPAEGVPVNQQVIDLVEGHIRHILYTANKDSFSYQVYEDLLAGGFSIAKVYTDYSSPMSFDQQIYLERAFDPTLCGFDPMARAPHKGDGNWCFELYPMTENDFKKEFPDVRMDGFSFTRRVSENEFEEFNWSYKDAKQNNVILVADYFEKKKKRRRIVKLADGRTMTIKNYEKMQAYWKDQQFIEQMPVIIGKPRWTTLEVICKYRLVESQVLSYEELDYAYLPLVFIDGHSINLTEGTSNCTYQMTRPYIYHAKGIQDLKNFAGMAWANYLENMLQSKFIIMKEAIPQEDDYIEMLTNIQRAGTIVVNAYSENNPDKPINNPIQPVVNPPAPPEMMNAFQMADPTTQTILGSFASNLGKNDNDLSGKAVIESSTVGNAAAMPYVVGYLQGLTQIGCIIVDLMPKYLVGKRTLPVIKLNGDKEYIKVNYDEGMMLDYAEHALHVNISAGVNFQVQKNRAVEQIIALMGANETLGAFFSDEDGGLPVLARNLTIYGADQLPEAIDTWAKKRQQQQAQQQQMQQQMMMNDPAMLKAKADIQKVELEKMQLQMQQQQQQFDNQIAIAKQSIEKILADSKVMEAEAKITQTQIDSGVRMEEAQTSLETHALDSAAKMAEVREREHASAMKEADMHHSHEMARHENAREHMRLHHEIKKGEKQNETRLQDND